MASRKELASTHGLMATSTTARGQKTKCMGQDSSGGTTVELTLENGSTAKWMEQVLTSGTTAGYTSAAILKTSSKEWEHTCGLMDEHTEASGTKANSMALATTFCQTKK